MKSELSWPDPIACSVVYQLSHYLVVSFLIQTPGQAYMARTADTWTIILRPGLWPIMLIPVRNHNLVYEPMVQSMPYKCSQSKTKGKKKQRKKQKKWRSSGPKGHQMIIKIICDHLQYKKFASIHKTQKDSGEEEGQNWRSSQVPKLTCQIIHHDVIFLFFSDGIN